MTTAKTTAASPSPAQAKRKAAAKAPAKPAAKPATKPDPKPTPKAAPKAAPKAPAKPAATAERPAEPSAKPIKGKLVRDSFTLPEQDHALISQLKKRALAGAHAAKKSEVLRAALRLLASLSDDELLTQLRAVPALKTGRPRSRK